MLSPSLQKKAHTLLGQTLATPSAVMEHPFYIPPNPGGTILAPQQRRVWPSHGKVMAKQQGNNPWAAVEPNHGFAAAKLGYTHGSSMVECPHGLSIHDGQAQPQTLGMVRLKLEVATTYNRGSIRIYREIKDILYEALCTKLRRR